MARTGTGAQRSKKLSYWLSGRNQDCCPAENREMQCKVPLCKIDEYLDTKEVWKYPREWNAFTGLEECYKRGRKVEVGLEVREEGVVVLHACTF